MDVRTKSTTHTQNTAFFLIFSHRIPSWVFSIDLSLKNSIIVAKKGRFLHFLMKILKFLPKRWRCLFQQRLDFISENGNTNGHCLFWQSTRLTGLNLLILLGNYVITAPVYNLVNSLLTFSHLCLTHSLIPT